MTRCILLRLVLQTHHGANFRLCSPSALHQLAQKRACWGFLLTWLTGLWAQNCRAFFEAIGLHTHKNNPGHRTNERALPNPFSHRPLERLLSQKQCSSTRALAHLVTESHTMVPTTRRAPSPPTPTPPVPQVTITSSHIRMAKLPPRSCCAVHHRPPRSALPRKSAQQPRTANCGLKN